METENRPIPYEGNEKYIFISYAHKDSEIVLPIISNMISKGYRVWYDDGISPGTEWPEVIATHLNDCEVCIAFLSNSYVDSFNCKREIDFAIRKRKQLLSVFLEDTNLPLGVEMQISTTQSVEYYKISKELFFEKLYASDFMKKSGCRDDAENITENIAENKYTCSECGYAFDKNLSKCPECGCLVEGKENKADVAEAANAGTPVTIYISPKKFIAMNDVSVIVDGCEKWRGRIGDYAEILLNEKKKVEINVSSSMAAVGGEWAGEIDPKEGTKYCLSFVSRQMFQKSKFKLEKVDSF